MSTTSTDTTRFLGSSIETLAPSPNTNSHTSKTYKQARDLFLTRRLPEAYSTIESLVTVPLASGEDQNDDEQHNIAPIAKASRSQRIKVWSLYLTLLNAIHELGPEEGKVQFGSKKWKTMTSRAWDGSIWDEVVQNGYGGLEGSVDADVVINLYVASRIYHFNPPDSSI